MQRSGNSATGYSGFASSVLDRKTMKNKKWNWRLMTCKSCRHYRVSLWSYRDVKSKPHCAIERSEFPQRCVRFEYEPGADEIEDEVTE